MQSRAILYVGDVHCFYVAVDHSRQAVRSSIVGPFCRFCNCALVSFPHRLSIRQMIRSSSAYPLVRRFLRHVM
jgi:hypothetical protein